MKSLQTLKVDFVAGTLGQGGSERQLFYMVRTLVEAGADVRVLTLRRDEFWEKPISNLGVPVVWVGKREPQLSRLVAVTRAVAARRPQVVQSQHFFANLYATGAARLLRLTDIGALRNDAMREAGTSGWFRKPSLRTPRSLVVNSHRAFVAAQAMGVAPARLHYLPNVVDCRSFTPTLKAKSESVALLIAGRLTRQKRVDRFLEALARLPLHVRGVIAGDGPERDQLRTRARALGLAADRLEFRGIVDDMRTMYAQADAVVLASDWEGNPNVVLEAMASGLPVVATDVGDVGETVAHGETGFVVPVGDDQGFTEALLRVSQDRELRAQMGVKGRGRAESEFSVDTLHERLAQLYRWAER